MSRDYKKSLIMLLIIALHWWDFIWLQKKREWEKLGKLFEFIQIISGRKAPGTETMTSGYHYKTAVFPGSIPLLECIMFPC